MKLTIDKCFIGIPMKADPETEHGFSPLDRVTTPGGRGWEGRMIKLQFPR